MKKVLGILVLGLLLSGNAKADNISDFQIEGISIGDSLLKYYSEKDIKKYIAKKQGYNDKSFVRGVICKSESTHSFCKVKKDLTTYDAIQFHFKKECLAFGNCLFNTSDLYFFTPTSISLVISTNFFTNFNLL